MTDPARRSRSPEEGDLVRVVGGDYDGRTGTYEGREGDALGAWHLVHLDGWGPLDPALRCDAVETVDA